MLDWEELFAPGDDEDEELTSDEAIQRFAMQLTAELHGEFKLPVPDEKE
jgi:hypothetical protein